jgi:hypothetical protein
MTLSLETGGLEMKAARLTPGRANAELAVWALLYALPFVAWALLVWAPVGVAVAVASAGVAAAIAFAMRKAYGAQPGTFRLALIGPLLVIWLLAAAALYLLSQLQFPND